MTRRSVLRRRAGAWLKLGAREKLELFLLAGMALAAEVAVKVISLPRLTRALRITLAEHTRPAAALERGRSARRLDDVEIERRAALVDRLYRAWPRKSSCLRRALVLGYRIREANPVLWIGVAKEDDAIRAHAWVEVDGRVVGDDTGEFAPLRSHKNAG
jgi:hypothetical protein